MDLIDINVLKQIGNDVGLDVFDSLIEIFISDSEERLESLKNQYADRDLANLKITAHTFKSVCAQYGAMSCSAIAKELEKLCADPSSDINVIGEKVEALTCELGQALKEIKTISIE